MKIKYKFYFKALISLGVILVLNGSAWADSLWLEGAEHSLVADKIARGVGDIITVVVQENNTTSKDSSTKTGRQDSVDASISSFLYSPSAPSFLTHKGKMPSMGYSGKNNFQGSGAIANSETITHRFGVRVVDVLPNRNLIVEGLRQTSFSQESQTVILRGTLRVDDIAPNNTVFSYNLADVTIKFENSGVVSAAQKKGWFSRAWDVLAPF